MFRTPPGMMSNGLSAPLYLQFYFIIIPTNFLLLLQPYETYSYTVPKNESIECKKIPEDVLEEILGPAFNGHYMSITLPEETSSDTPVNKKREADFDETLEAKKFSDEEYNDEPAWDIKNHAAKLRNKREPNYTEEWHCKSKITWVDLGPEYFPRYLRSVECIGKNCWFNIYNCRPKSFTLKLLKKRSNKCVKNDPERRSGISGLPKELVELWVWEERSVTFCCDCKL